jgi:quercetin dioxygenase-like cupin family protein
MQMQTQPTQTEPSSASEPVVLARGEGEAVWFLDNLITVKVRSAHGVRFGVVESCLPEGSRTPFHRHDGEDEALYVLEGALTVFLAGGRTVQAGPGAYVHFPRGVAHGLRADAATRVLVLSEPDGFVEMIREAGRPAERRELPPKAAPDLARVEAACTRRRIALLGPLPG